MINEVHTLTFGKVSQRRLRDKVINKQLGDIIAKVRNRGQELAGWHLDTNNVGTGEAEEATGLTWTHFPMGDKVHRYESYIKVSYQRDDDLLPEKGYFQALCKQFNTAAAPVAVGGWSLTTVDGEEYEEAEEGDILLTKDFVGYATVEMPEDFEDHFTHLYGLEYQIHRIKCALEAGIQSEWEDRFHAVLWGPPGCGKTDVMQTVKECFPEESVLEFDATATTSAGAIKQLAEMADNGVLPRIMVIEEIEKVINQNAITHLLAIMDQRAEIRKTTARASINKDARLFVLCTVNNYDLFEKMQAGALESRFSTKVHFARPNRDTLRRILERDISKLPLGGNFAWIDPTLDFCEKYGITDPRQVKAICLCGRDELLDGTYQRMLVATDPSLVEQRDAELAG